MKNYQFPEKQACIGDNVSLYAATKGMTDTPQYWKALWVCMGVWCGAFYGHLRTETDFYGLQLVRRVRRD